MASKRNTASKDADEIRRSLDFLSEEVTAVRQQQKMILDLVDEVKALRLLNAEKDRKIAFLEKRVDDLEQYTRMNDIIVTGLETKPRTYARAASKGIRVDSSNIKACHPIPRKNKSDKPAIIVRFVNRKHEVELLRQGRKLKGTQVYLNEHLTKRNADIARTACFLRKQKIIQSTWTANCKVFIKLNEAPEVLLIRDIEELDKYQ
ncbi:hypothetical protein SKAU_G00152550 [Synaphobranchus kaupii]|uniref:Zinc finger DNA binding protein n=1 Tax=Synaphobranchus kaupii TaxID=118154 RepID=A0A9Q1FHG9_SYNKA|nr:hypothetical protein SKAU_G00152550 [Synaphobranchus kaupii]